MENGHEPATKADLKQLGDQLRSEFQHGFDHIKKTMRDVQTELLKSFYGFTETVQLEVEKRLNLPPAA